MLQPKRQYEAIQEYPGSTIWRSYEVFCPACGQWVKEYGDVDEKDEDGDYHKLCLPCGKIAWEKVENETNLSHTT